MTVILEGGGGSMRNTLLVVFAALALAETLFSARTGLVDARNDLQETPPPQTTALAVPPECISVMRDRPTTFSILGSRSYDKRAVIDVLYSWGKGTNYPGDQEVVSFIFRLEDKSWLMDDIYFFNGRYATASSLQEELQRHY
jgi:hypothetical protein